MSGRLDLNHDGTDDLIIGAHHADPGDRADGGAVYVIYGRPGLGSTGVIELSELDGENGFVIHGINSGDLLGASGGPGGDLNEDGIDDLLLGAWGADPHGIEEAGQTYVIFGRAADSDEDGIANNLDKLHRGGERRSARLERRRLRQRL